MSEPPAKAQVQKGLPRLRPCKRNSKATPRRISPASMKITGRYSAGIRMA
jgi:hypothetical protein